MNQSYRSNICIHEYIYKLILIQKHEREKCFSLFLSDSFELTKVHTFDKSATLDVVC